MLLMKIIFQVIRICSGENKQDLVQQGEITTLNDKLCNLGGNFRKSSSFRWPWEGNFTTLKAKFASLGGNFHETAGLRWPWAAKFTTPKVKSSFLGGKLHKIRSFR